MNGSKMHWSGWAQHNAPGPFTAAEIAAMVANNGLAGLWDTSIVASVVLNGSRVSSILDQTGLGLALTQGAGTQPLYVGAAAYGLGSSWPSIKFTRASAERLSRANTNLSPEAGGTIVSAHRYRVAAGADAYVASLTTAAHTAGIAIGSTTASNNRDVRCEGTSTHQDSTISTTAPEIWIATFRNGFMPKLYLNGVDTTLAAGAGTSVIAPGATAELAWGALSAGTAASDMDGMFLAYLTTSISVAMVASLNARLRRRLNI